ncbi:MAG: alpha/beta fold hydrolase [Candidatus Rokubacteria bacterium]|nr:alpha/beta fold hydrolase [Candidatus Rokubacteria bacterium]
MLKPTEHFMTTWDGSRLFYRAWQPPIPSHKALVLFHRGHEHSGRLEDVVNALALDDVFVFAWDARGHGLSPGERGYANSFADLVKDAEAFVQHISTAHDIPVENMVVLAHSVGAVIAAAWVHDYAPPIRGQILVSPAFRVKLYVPLAIPMLRLWRRLRARPFVRSYVTGKWLTHDPEQIARYDGDGLISHAIAVNVLLDLRDTATRVMEDAGAIHVPTLLLAAGSDRVVKLPPQRRFFVRLSSPVKKMQVFPELYHDLLHENDRDRPLAEARQFILDAFLHPPTRPRLTKAGEGYNHAEYARLAEPLPRLSPRRLYFGCLRLLLKTVGRLSGGIRLGWQSGFDSGQSLDYVYANTPRGITPLGRLLDRIYLNSVGWRAIRQRKANLEKVLGATILNVLAEGMPARLVDIAAGPGRYVLETLKTLSPLPIAALLRDRDPANLEMGRRLARELEVANVTYERGDAFDPASLAAIAPPPTIAVVSGLYELFPDNDLIARSLGGLSAALADGGFLIYTNQPVHPQVELIARVLVNRDGRPWVMRRRPQVEMDELVRAAGFEKIRAEIDEFGIFSVSLARKRVGGPIVLGRAA